MWLRTRYETVCNDSEVTRVEIIQEGPFVIARAMLHDTYLLKHPDSTVFGVMPGSRLRPFDQRMRDNNAPWTIEDDEEANINTL